jgi:hypothetical protein
MLNGIPETTVNQESADQPEPLKSKGAEGVYPAPEVVTEHVPLVQFLS